MTQIYDALSATPFPVRAACEAPIRLNPAIYQDFQHTFSEENDGLKLVFFAMECDCVLRYVYL